MNPFQSNSGFLECSIMSEAPERQVIMNPRYIAERESDDRQSCEGMGSLSEPFDLKKYRISRQLSLSFDLENHLLFVSFITEAAESILVNRWLLLSWAWRHGSSSSATAGTWVGKGASAAMFRWIRLPVPHSTPCAPHLFTLPESQ